MSLYTNKRLVHNLVFGLWVLTSNVVKKNRNYNTILLKSSCSYHLLTICAPIAEHLSVRAAVGLFNNLEEGPVHDTIIGDIPCAYRIIPPEIVITLWRLLCQDNPVKIPVCDKQFPPYFPDCFFRQALDNIFYDRNTPGAFIGPINDGSCHFHQENRRIRHSHDSG